jgi:UDP-N-acetyl-D-glucosamine dehydrogenase
MPNVGDVRESAAIEVLAALRKRGADVLFADPFVEQVDEHGLELSASKVTVELLESVDCVALLTPHDAFDYRMLVDHARLVFDARNELSVRSRDSVVTL